MNKQEFESKAIRPINDSDYQEVEYVYLCHPGIDQDRGIDQLAALYSESGMLIIEHMAEQAQRAVELWEEMDQCQRKLDLLKAEFASIKNECLN